MAQLTSQAVRLLQRAPKLGIEPNTIMYNTAISALGKANQWELAEKLFGEIPEPDNERRVLQLNGTQSDSITLRNQ